MYFSATGKWSDAGRWSDADSKVGVLSTEIRCYKSFGFCEEADAYSVNGQAVVGETTYDIVRWDATGIVAVDNAPCIVNTLQIDFGVKRVATKRTLRANTKEVLCGAFSSQDARTSLLGGVSEEKEKNTRKADSRD